MTRPRRLRLSRPGPLGVLAVVLPAVTLAAALGTDARVDDGGGSRPPTTSDLVRTALVCPSGEGDTAVGTATGESGTVTLTASRADDAGGRRAAGRDVDLAPDRLTEVTGSDAAEAHVVLAEDALAPGLFATRVGGPRLSGLDCPTPSADQWFTGVGAGATHRSVLELTNPDAGPAVASVTLFGGSGPVDASMLQGIAVPGRGTVRIDLATVVPRRSQLALHVTSDRGRIAAAVLDTVDELGPSPATTDYLPAQAAPESLLRLLGLPAPGGRRVLAVANPGADAVRVDLKLVSPTAVFTPSSAQELVVDPGTVRTVDLGEVLGAKSAQDAFGVQLESTGPITASIHSSASGDLVQTVPATTITDETRMALPAGDAQVEVAGSTGVGVVKLTGWTAEGRRVVERSVEIVPGRGLTIDLPDGVRLLSLSPERTTVQAAVRVTRSGTGRGTGTVVLPMRELLRRSLVPDVSPGPPQG